MTERSSKVTKMSRIRNNFITVVPTKSDRDGILCFQLLNKQLTGTIHLIECESIDHLCINPIPRMGLIHTLSIDYKTLIMV